MADEDVKTGEEEVPEHEKNGIVYETVPDNLPAKIDPEAMYDVTIKTAIPDFFGSPLRPEQNTVMKGALVTKFKASIRVATLSRQTI